MTISTELMLAILSLDAYNRGYDEGIDHGKDQIGGATVGELPNTVDLDEWQAAGFYAAAYTIGAGVEGLAAGTTVISYRGTDQLASWPWSDSGSDAWNGYGIALGNASTTQARLATEFYQTVTGTENSDPRTGEAILTGHSLGGGLAGLIGAVYNKKAHLYDHMPFQPPANDNTTFARCAA